VSTKRTFGVAVSALLTFAALVPDAHAARRTYCCDDKTGRRICGDTLPEQCEGRAYRLTDEKGVVKHVEAPLTAEQKAQRDADAARKKEEEKQAAEQRRKDMALLNSYTNEKDIDAIRDRAIAEVEKIIKQAQDKIDVAQKRKLTLDKEAEFYLKKPMPDALKSQIRENEAELQGQKKIIDDKRQEIETLKLKFEDEKRRYRELTDKSKAAPGSVHPAAVPRPH
jgi:hypothetical protein